VVSNECEYVIILLKSQANSVVGHLGSATFRFFADHYLKLKSVTWKLKKIEREKGNSELHCTFQANCETIKYLCLFYIRG